MEETSSPQTKRACDAASKGARRKKIMRESRALLARAPYAEVTMARIASEVGLAKGTVYLYVDGKEGVFLRVLDELFRGWCQELEEELSTIDAHAGDGSHELETAETIANIFADSLAERPLLRRLLVLQRPLLQVGRTPEGIKKRERKQFAQMEPVARRLEQTFGRLHGGGGQRFMRWSHAMAIGAQQLVPPAESLLSPHGDTVDAAERAELRVELRAHLRDGLLAWLRGWPEPAN